MFSLIKPFLSIDGTTLFLVKNPEMIEILKCIQLNQLDELLQLGRIHNTNTHYYHFSSFSQKMKLDIEINEKSNFYKIETEDKYIRIYHGEATLSICIHTNGQTFDFTYVISNGGLTLDNAYNVSKQCKLQDSEIPDILVI